MHVDAHARLAVGGHDAETPFPRRRGTDESIIVSRRAADVHSLDVFQNWRFNDLQCKLVAVWTGHCDTRRKVVVIMTAALALDYTIGLAIYAKQRVYYLKIVPAWDVDTLRLHTQRKKGGICGFLHQVDQNASGDASVSALVDHVRLPLINLIL